MDLRMPTTQREQLLFAIGFLALIGAGAYWYFRYSPVSGELVTKREYVEAIEARNSRARADLARGTVAQLTAQANEYQANLDLMRQLVPESNQLPVLVDQISTAARRVGLDVGTLAPLGPEIGTDFDAHRYELTVTGSYHTVAEFLTNVASLSRIVVPVKVRLGAAPPENTDPERSVVTMFELHTYVLKADTLPPAGGG